MPDDTNADRRPAALGEGPMANSIQGGHVADVDGVPFPRWMVAVESTTADGPSSGVVVDLVHRSIARWFLVAPGDPLIGASGCGMGMGTRHLCVPTAYRMDGGRLARDPQIAMIAPIVDHLSSWWEHRDGPAPARSGDEEAIDDYSRHHDPDRATIDGRAFAMLADLHAGATAVETREGVWTMREPQIDDGREARIVREHAASAGHQLAHWGLAAWTGSSSLSITPAGRGLAAGHGHPAGPAKGSWSKDVEIGEAPDVVVVDHEIDEPRELDVPCDGTLHVDRRHDGHRRGGGTVNLKFDGQAEGVVMDMSAARALVDQLAPPLVKGSVSRVRIDGRDAWNHPVVTTIAIGDGEVVIRTESRAKERYDVRFDAIRTRLFRTILREAVKKDGRGGALDDVEILKTTREAHYGAVSWA